MAFIANMYWQTYKTYKHDKNNLRIKNNLNIIRRNGNIYYYAQMRTVPVCLIKYNPVSQ